MSDIIKIDSSTVLDSVELLSGVSKEKITRLLDLLVRVVFDKMYKAYNDESVIKIGIPNLGDLEVLPDGRTNLDMLPVLRDLMDKSLVEGEDILSDIVSSLTRSQISSIKSSLRNLLSVELDYDSNEEEDEGEEVLE